MHEFSDFIEYVVSSVEWDAEMNDEEIEREKEAMRKRVYDDMQKFLPKSVLKRMQND